MKCLLAGLHAEGPSCLNYPPITSADGQHRGRRVRTRSPALAVCCPVVPPSASLLLLHPAAKWLNTHTCSLLCGIQVILLGKAKYKPQRNKLKAMWYLFLEEMGRLMPSSESGRCRVIILSTLPGIESVCRCQSQMGLRE